MYVKLSSPRCNSNCPKRLRLDPLRQMVSSFALNHRYPPILMLDDEEKHRLALSSSTTVEPRGVADDGIQSHTARPSPLYSVSARIKQFFPIVKSRSTSGLPTIVTTSPPTPSDPYPRNDGLTQGRMSSSSVENSNNAPSS